jgi:hypothetical protein
MDRLASWEEIMGTGEPTGRHATRDGTERPDRATGPARVDNDPDPLAETTQQERLIGLAARIREEADRAFHPEGNRRPGR